MVGDNVLEPPTRKWEVAFMVGDNVLAPPTRKWEVAFKVGGDVPVVLQAPAP